MNEINICYNNGHGKMHIYLDLFLPCPQTKFKKLLNIIELDWEHQDELKATLESCLKEKLADLKDLLKENLEKYSFHHEEMIGWSVIVETKKHANGVKLTEDELKMAKDFLSRHKRSRKTIMSDIKKNKRFIFQAEKGLEILEQRRK